MPYRSILIAAVQAAGLTVAGFLVPVLGQIVVLFAPVPLITVTMREGRKAGIIAMGISEGMMRRLRPELAILAGGILPLAALIVLLTPLLLKAGKNPITLTEDYLRTSITQAQQLYTQLGLADVAQMLASVSDKMLYYLVRLSPGLILTTTLVQALCCYGMARTILRRKDPGLPVLDKPSFAEWHAPDPWVWGLIATLGLVASGLITKVDSVAFFVGLNLAFLYLLVYTAQGAALVEFWLRKMKIAVVWRSFAHTIILTLPPLIAVVIALGVVDIWADFRKVRTPVQNP